MELAWVLDAAQTLLALSALLCGARALRGPTLADRVAALELMVTLGIGLSVTAAVGSEQVALLDVGLVLALVGFLSTVAFARGLEDDE